MTHCKKKDCIHYDVCAFKACKFVCPYYTCNTYDRPQGEWVNHRNDYGHNIADCSLCGKAMQWHDEDEDGIPRYCWNCGAAMGGVEMTNKEAIEKLKEILFMTGYKEALDLAIKALETSQGEWIRLDSAKRVIARFKGYLDDDMIERVQIALEKEYKVEMQKGGTDCMDEDAKQASIPYTYNAPQHDWKCGYPNITSGKGGAE